ncbi:MAG TPA: hypothetical protein VGZ01_11525, partial [Trinickia sp.]|nr:hypothetical protein [Trinickia sp.]
MNDPTTSPRRLHPLVATAAAAVLIASLVATAAITGVFPKATSSSAQGDQTQSAQVAAQPAPPPATQPQPVIDSAAPANAAAANQQQSAA